MVLHLRAPKGKVSVEVMLNRAKYFDRTGKVNDHTIYLSGNLGKNALEFAMCLSAKAKGGRVYTMGHTLVVKGADEAVLYFGADSTFRSASADVASWEPRVQDVLAEKITEKLERAMAREYGELLAEHEKDYREFYDRVALSLPEKEENAALPTDERLQRIISGGTDEGLAKLLFDYGRYLLIGCSRPGDLPATLQGIWNKDFMAPWDSKYTININTEMNYWPAEVCALPECHTALFDLIGRMREHGRSIARRMYGCRGFMAHHNTDLYGDCAPQDNWIPATIWTMGAAWLCTHLWMHYSYTQDLEFLKWAYPVMAEAALFFVDFLEEKDGYLVTNPSLSPENVYILPNGEQGCCCMGATMDLEILRELFTGCKKAAEILGDAVDEAEIPDVSDMRKFQTFRICGNYRRRSMQHSKSCRRSVSIPQEESWNGWRSTRKQSRDTAMCRSCTVCILPIRSRWIKHQSLPPRLRKPCVYALQTAAAIRAGAGHGSSIFMRSCGMVKRRGRTFARCWQNPPMPIFLTATRRSR